MKTVKWIILFVVSIAVGSFVDTNILEKVNINVWLSRSLGCLVAVVIALVMYHYFFKKTSKS